VPHSATTHEHVQRMLDEIHQRYNERLTLAGLAKVLRRQSAYLGRLFREELGVTVHEYITRARMVFGAAQVRAGVKIEAVSLDLGYLSKKNFYRQFKRRFGMTPEAYRNDCNGCATNTSIAAAQPRKRPNHQRSAATSASNNGPDGFPAEQEQGTDSLGPARQLNMARSGWSVALLVTDEDGRYVGATPAAVRLTGYSVSELRGMPVEALFPDGPGSKTQCRVQVLHPVSASHPATTVLQTKSAARIRIHVTSVENLLGHIGNSRPRTPTMHPAQH
jgi:AraC-like DNA-binding protein